jgi:GH15 family glucan-1,4-alpha-glucosidase
VLPIKDYAAIGDCRSAALVSRTGSIDWLCWPRFDSPSLFGALLDDRAGHWRIAPVPPGSSRRRYLERTNVVETTFDSDGGTLVLTDLMPVASEQEKREILVADHEILRVARCTRGELEVEMVLEPRPGYGRERPQLRDAGKLGVRLATAEGLLVLRAGAPLTVTDGRAHARLRLRAGQTLHASLTFAGEGPAVLPPLGDWSERALARTVAWWQRWASRLANDGPAAAAVVRSALALKLLCYAPSGAVVAAPTTSLPERVGGDLNWDYRYCWLRDAALTVRALFGLGFDDEAATFVSWMVHSTWLTQPEAKVLYDVHGKRPQTEWIVTELSGHLGSRPVRVGNAATDQFQLDVYGEIIDAVAQLSRRGGVLDRDTQATLRGFGQFVCRNWRQPDEGIWEPRSGRAHNTHSRVLCWTALERLIALHEAGHLARAPIDTFKTNRALIRREVEDRGWNARLGSYVSRLDGDDVDAALLMLSWYGFEPAASARMRGTYACIRDRLGAGDGLLYRYRTEDSPGEGAFGICSFWGVEYLATSGAPIDEVQRVFEGLCRRANDVGLFAEEIDPATGQPLGNFPQAFTHVGLINAALSLQQRLGATGPTPGASL